MKTLDEVIKACEETVSDVDRGVDIEGCYLGATETRDALHYLKEYKKYIDTMCALPDYYEYIHSADNPPLTWDELKQMEGKPVWIEESAENGLWWTYWVIWEGDNAVLPKKDYSTKWQAYRKERK